MSADREPAWVSSLRDVTRRAASAAGGEVEVLRGFRPPLFDADAARAASSLLLAAFVIAAAIFRERVRADGVGIDLIALLLRATGLAFIVRAALALCVFASALSRRHHAPNSLLALGPEGLFLRSTQGEQWASRADVLSIARNAQPETSAIPKAARPLCLVLRPKDGKPRLLFVPAFFAGNEEILASRITRWLEQEGKQPRAGLAPSKPNPDGRYARIARGECEPFEVQVPEGTGYLKRAPYGAILGCIFTFDALHSAGPLADSLRPGAMAACALALAFLAGWFYWMRGRRKSRLGIAMALTREDILLRGKAGVVSIPWVQVTEIDVDVRLTWSPFFGSYPVHILYLATLDGDRVNFDGGFLGIPAEAVARLCESYRQRLI